MFLIVVLIGFVVMLPATIVTSYLMAAFSGHTVFLFPYISDTGAFPPESSVFGQMMNVTAFLLFHVVFFRNLQVKQYITALRLPKYVSHLNTASLASGWLAVMSISVTANFQSTSASIMHIAGAYGLIAFALLFMLFDSLISFRTSPVIIARNIAICKLLTFTAYLVALLLTCFFGYTANQLFTGSNAYQWRKTDGGWALHITSAFCEWGMVGIIDIYFMLFAGEFRHARLSCPAVDLDPKLVMKMSQFSEPSSSHDSDDANESCLLKDKLNLSQI